MFLLTFQVPDDGSADVGLVKSDVPRFCDEVRYAGPSYSRYFTLVFNNPTFHVYHITDQPTWWHGCAGSRCLQLLGVLEIREISWNFIDAPGKFNCQLRYDIMPITEPNLVMSLTRETVIWPWFLCSFIHDVSWKSPGNLLGWVCRHPVVFARTNCWKGWSHTASLILLIALNLCDIPSTQHMQLHNKSTLRHIAKLYVTTVQTPSINACFFILTHDYVVLFCWFSTKYRCAGRIPETWCCVLTYVFYAYYQCLCFIHCFIYSFIRQHWQHAFVMHK